MTARPQRYLSYLLRMWRTAEEGEGSWRASLEAPGTGERRGFASLQDLVRWLEDLSGGAGVDPDPLALVPPKRE